MNEANINEDEDIDYLNDVLVTKVVLASDKVLYIIEFCWILIKVAYLIIF